MRTRKIPPGYAETVDEAARVEEHNARLSNTTGAQAMSDERFEAFFYGSFRDAGFTVGGHPVSSTNARHIWDAALSSREQAGAVAREFTNELGNAIRITIEGPTSVSENVLTPIEVDQLRSALNQHAAPEDGRISLIESLEEIATWMSGSWDGLPCRGPIPEGVIIQQHATIIRDNLPLLRAALAAPGAAVAAREQEATASDIADDVALTIVRDVAELEPADPEHPSTLCVKGEDLRLIVHRTVLASREEAPEQSAETAALKDAIRRAETSHSGMSYGDDKAGGPSEYARGWGDCLSAIKGAALPKGGEGEAAKKFAS